MHLEWSDERRLRFTLDNVVDALAPSNFPLTNPAVLKRIRLNPRAVAAMLHVQWWRFAPWQLKDIDFSEPDKAIGPLRLLASSEKPYGPEPVKLKALAAEAG